MSNEIITNALKEANIQLRNMEVASEGNTFSVAYAKAYGDYLSYMVQVASKMHLKCQDAIVKDATSTLILAGYEVVSPKREATPSSVDIAIALLVKNGYKVTDPNGGNY